ncbi:hypothetical protein [Marinobacter sp. M-5]|uniref:hypothetical protein n=1 Tax=Marinobacter sp. M-5 TaxID=3081089 RepID=UPI00293C1A8F|nr:hypothetical protein [Marinobacter sp. M-5]MDV3502524.1 hypothetical protein [Marinobacter sp. M-5]
MSDYDFETSKEFPNVDSAEYRNTERRVRKAVRLLLKEGHPFEPSMLLQRQEVIYALQGVLFPDPILRTMIVPWMDCRDFIWEEYAEKRLWTVDEAASLSVGMDPFMFQFEPGQYNNDWREERERGFIKTREAILLKELTAVPEGNSYYVEPYEFCYWADGAGLLKSALAGPLRELALEDRRSGRVPTLEEAEERFVTYAQQRLLTDDLSQAESRRRALYEYAIFIKIDNPKFKREDIARRVFQTLSEDCQKIRGLTFNTIRNDLYMLDQRLISPSGQNLEFLNSVLSDTELMSTDPTHPWWNQWRPVIEKELPWLVLPE